MNHFSPQIIISNNREMVDQGNTNVYEYGMNQMDSGLTYSLPISRKRSRDSMSFDASDFLCQNGQFVNGDEYNSQKEMFTFLGQDMSMQIYQQQLEIDRFIANHTEKVRLAIQATRQRNSMRLIAAAQEGIKNKLRSKDDEIMKMSKLNYALEEKVKSLNVETQIWQEMAQTNEATANVLRLNLQQLITQIQQQQTTNDVQDNESCCGSNYEEHHDNNNGTTTIDNNGNRLCRNCGKVESCVLLLPCRHLCVCSTCESSINFCPTTYRDSAKLEVCKTWYETVDTSSIMHSNKTFFAGLKSILFDA
ncbi:probable BOI-related E3 ubiquitin-protein ligase 3 [Tanacetum coccineum]|uniref:Probable BOI-related E3 ubiquitin-protein ligase 3 n=1 Tax=Tanacetum coccineum TaxID=301880 RepID=A0ABQ4Y2Z4_9ASTR